MKILKCSLTGENFFEFAILILQGQKHPEVKFKKFG